MESSTLTRPLPIGLKKIWIVLPLLGALLYYSSINNMKSLTILIAIFCVAWSLINYEVNLAFFIFVLNAGAKFDPRWRDIAFTARWIFLFLFTFRSLLPWFFDRRKTEMTWFQVGVFLFCIICSFGTINAYVQPSSLYRTISLWFLVIALCFSIWKHMDSREKVIAWLRITVVIITCFLIMSLFYEDWRIVLIEAQHRFMGTYMNPNQLALVTLFQIPAAFYLYRYEKDRRKYSFVHYLYLAMSLLGLLSLLLTGSRASIGGMFGGVMAALALYYGRRFIMLFTLFLMLSIATIGIIEQIFETGLVQKVILREGSIKTMSGRSQLWEEGWELFKKRPLMGYGFGTSDQVLLSGGNPRKIDLAVRFGPHAHNSFLRSFIESGIIGTSFILLFVISFPLKLLKLSVKIRSKELHSLVLMFTVLITGSILNNFFESWLLSVGSLTCFLFWWSVMVIYKIELSESSFTEASDSMRTVSERILFEGEDKTIYPIERHA